MRQGRLGPTEPIHLTRLKNHDLWGGNLVPEQSYIQVMAQLEMIVLVLLKLMSVDCVGRYEFCRING